MLSLTNISTLDAKLEMGLDTTLGTMLPQRRSLRRLPTGRKTIADK
jgi:hypothetical protein